MSRFYIYHNIRGTYFVLLWIYFYSLNVNFQSFRCYHQTMKFSAWRKAYVTREFISNSNMTSFFRFVNKRAIYLLGIISLAHALVHVTDFPVVNVHVDELLSARIWQHKLCAKLSANVNISHRLPIKVYYRICTLRHIRIKIIHGRQNLFWVLTWVGRY